MPTNAVNFIIIYIAGMVILLYLFAILPAKRKNRKVRDLHEAVAVGDQIVTIGGIIGIVTEKNEETVKIRVDESQNTELTIVLAAVHNILTASDKK